MRGFTTRPVFAFFGAVAQLGERGLCKPEVVGSIPSSSTIHRRSRVRERRDRSPVSGGPLFTSGLGRRHPADVQRDL